MSDDHRIPSNIVGVTLPPSRRTLSERETTAYAAGIAAGRRSYFTTPSPLVPPSACVMLEWDVLNGETYRNLLIANQSQMERAIHVSQRSRFVRPLLTNKATETSGTIAGVRQLASGVLIAVDLTTEDQAGPLVESQFVALFAGAERDGEDVWPVSPMVLQAPHSRWRPLTIDPLAAHIYTACSNIWNPIHTDAQRALAAGLARPILHGTWGWAKLYEAAIDVLPSLANWEARFMSPVHPGFEASIAVETSNGEVRAWLRQGDRLCIAARGLTGETSNAQ